MKKIGIVGCGTIGGFLTKKISKELRDSAKLVGICDIDAKKARSLSGRLSPKAVSGLPLPSLLADRGQ